jgi:hypothetical protein
MRAWKKIAALIIAAAFMPAEISIRGIDPASLAIIQVAPAEARVGHPLTPLSYAGVARRTSRRVVRRTTIRVNTLPAGCVYGAYYGSYYYRCGGGYYARSGGAYVKVVIE